MLPNILMEFHGIIEFLLILEQEKADFFCKDLDNK